MSVSVVITCFNERSFIEQAYLSVVNQGAYELISNIFLVDDGSTDGSLEVIERVIEGNEKVQFIRLPNVGLAKARNTALEKVDTEWVSFLDGDDIWPKHKIESQLKAAAESGCGVIYTDSYRFGGENRYIPARTLPENTEKALVDYFLFDAPILSSVLVRKELFEKLGFFDPDLRVAQDTEMWTRLVANYSTHHIKEALLFRRIHPTSLGSDFDRKSKYLESVVEKIVKRFPQLEVFRARKLASIKVECAKRYIYGNKKIKALGSVLCALRLSHFNKEAWQIFIIILLPFSRILLGKLGRLRLRVYNSNATMRLEVPSYSTEKLSK